MIIPMSRVRVLGPRPLLAEAVRALQDFGRLHLDAVPAADGIEPVELSDREQRERLQLGRIADDLAAVARLLDLPPAGRPTPAPGQQPATREELARWARAASRVRRKAETLATRRASLEEEQALIGRYRGFFTAFQALLLARLARSEHVSAYGVIVPAAEKGRLGHLADELSAETGQRVGVAVQPLETGDLAVLITLPHAGRAKLEQALAGARIPEVPLPESYQHLTLVEAAPRMLARLEEIPRELAAVDEERKTLARQQGAELARAQVAVHDRLSAIEALGGSATTPHAFAIDGWLPSGAVADLRRTMKDRFGPSVVVEELARDAWASREAPVVLHNPRLFRPFEVLIQLMPLPRYGSIDPTPFVAVSFPMFFGLILGDIGYGVVLALIGIILYRRSRPDTLARTVAEIIGPCAAFAIIFGALFGELFGDLGRRLFGLHAILMDREQAVVASIAVAVGVGLVHILLGLALGATGSWKGHRKLAISRGTQFVMLLLIILAILAAVEVLPKQLFTPAVLLVFLGLPVIVLAEGIIAPVEFLAMLGSILSYVRIMALGTASVMLAVVANEMAGTMGSAIVGFLFALLFHLVNFALGLFSPTLHAMRLHYVEFFRQFYSPGGRRYEPFRHWHPPEGQHA